MKIVAFVFPGMTLIDLVGPMQALSVIPDVEIQIVAKKIGAVPTDAGITVTATHDFASCEMAPTVLFVPGNTRALCELLCDEETVEFVERVGKKSGWVTSVCNGSLLLAAAGLLRGYRAASYWYTRDELASFGATPDNGRVVFDRNRVTGGGMTAGVDFGLALLGKLTDEKNGAMFELLFEYAPEPPYQVGRPELAHPEMVATARDILADLMPKDLIQAAAKKWSRQS